MGRTDSIAPLRYFGSKWSIANWIVEHLPEHRGYVEVFGGSAAVLLTKSRSYAETYNDIEGGVVNFFRVLRDHPEELIRVCELTPFSRAEHLEAFEACDDSMEAARRFFVRSWLTRGGYQREGHTRGFWVDPGMGRGSAPAATFARLPARLRLVADRLAGVVIEQLDWRSLFRRYDREGALFYCDPPYMWETRIRRSVYLHEWGVEEHCAFLTAAAALEHGMVALSGYRSDLYDAELADWLRVETGLTTQTGKRRVECLWLSPRAAEMCRQRTIWHEMEVRP